MRTLNLSGFKVGDSPLIGVAQGAVTAYYQPPAWGGTGGDGGTISITINTPDINVAPQRVLFRVDLSQATFDAQAPTGDEVYDARKHELIYFWTLDDDAGDWTAPEKGFPEWKDRNVTNGFETTHVYEKPRPASGGAGNGYNPSVLVVEPATGKTAYATIELFVEDPDVVYAGANTVCVNMEGDNDWSYADAQHPGSVHVQIPGDWLRAEGGDDGVKSAAWLSHGEQKKRWCFKRGGEWTANIWMGGGCHGVLFTDYGDPAEPLPALKGNVNIRPNNGIDGTIFYTQNFFGTNGTPKRPICIRVANLHLKGNFDTTLYDELITYDFAAANGITLNAVFFLSPSDFIMHNCKVTGWPGANVHFVLTTEDEMHATMSNTVFWDYGGQYPLFFGPTAHPDSSCNLVALKCGRDPLALESPDTRRAICRASWWAHNICRDSEFFKTETIHGPVQMIRHPQGTMGDGANYVLVNNYFESSAFAAGVCNDAHPFGRSTVHNVIFRGNVWLGIAAPGQMFVVNATGVTIENNLAVIPARKRFSGRLRLRFRGLVKWSSIGTDIPSWVENAPIRVNNNTVYLAKTYAQNGDTLDFVEGGTWPANGWNALFRNVTESNNVFHAPNYTPAINDPSAPRLSQYLWQPRCIGIVPSYWDNYLTLAAPVPNGGTLFIPYSTFRDETTICTRAMIDEGSAWHVWQDPATSTFNLITTGKFSVAFSDTGATVTNLSGATWPAGTVPTHQFKLSGATAPLLTHWGMALEDFPDLIPTVPGLASSGDRAFQNVTGGSRYPAGVYTEGTINAGYR